MRSGLLISLISLVTAAVATKQLDVKVSGPSTVNRVDDLKFTTTVTNNGDEALRILNDPNSAMSNFGTDKFTIADPSGTKPSFRGVRVKYVPAIAARNNGFTTLEPQQSVTIEHDLSETYAFNNKDEKAYTFHAEHTFTLVNPDLSLSKLTAIVRPHTATVSADLAKPPSRRNFRREQFDGCSADQQNIIKNAVDVATNYVANGDQYLVNPPSNSTGERYITWFGPTNAEEHDFVNSALDNLQHNDFSTFIYDCTTCTDPNNYAYVYPNRYGIIYLCAMFWNANLQGTNSQGGTIVHEASQFLTNAGTQDYEYGQDDCMELAQTSPAHAILNADNYEYFVENNPSLN